MKMYSIIDGADNSRGLHFSYIKQRFMVDIHDKINILNVLRIQKMKF